MSIRNIKLLLELWGKELIILWKDIVLFKLRCTLDYKLFKIENQKIKLRDKGLSEEEINSL